MKQCSITGKPIHVGTEVVIIPILISKDTIYRCYPNDNVHPFPIALNGVYNGERFENMFEIDKSDEKTVALLSIVSDVLGYVATWDDFIASEGEEVLFEDKVHFVSFFACEKKIFNQIFTYYQCENRFAPNKDSNFADFVTGFKKDVFKHLDFIKRHIVSSKLVGKDILPANANYNFVITDNFKESYLDYFAEVYFLNMYLNLIGKEWSNSKDLFIEEENSFSIRY